MRAYPPDSRNSLPVPRAIPSAAYTQLFRPAPPQRRCKPAPRIVLGFFPAPPKYTRSLTSAAKFTENQRRRTSSFCQCQRRLRREPMPAPPYSFLCQRRRVPSVDASAADVPVLFQRRPWCFDQRRLEYDYAPGPPQCMPASRQYPSARRSSGFLPAPPISSSYFCQRRRPVTHVQTRVRQANASAA